MLCMKRFVSEGEILKGGTKNGSKGKNPCSS